MKQKATKENPKTWHGRVRYGVGRAKLLTWGVIYFCAESRIFQPESAPNSLSFAPRLNLSNIRSGNINMQLK